VNALFTVILFRGRMKGKGTKSFRGCLHGPFFYYELALHIALQLKNRLYSLVHAKPFTSASPALENVILASKCTLW